MYIHSHTEELMHGSSMVSSTMATNNIELAWARWVVQYVDVYCIILNFSFHLFTWAKKIKMWLAAEVTEPYSRNLPLNEAGDPERASAIVSETYALHSCI